MRGAPVSAMRPAFSEIVWPEADGYSVRNVRVPLCMVSDLASPCEPSEREDDVGLFDLAIVRGRLARIAPAGTLGAEHGPPIDLQGRQAWPMLVDAHTHLDRGHTVVRSPNPSGSFADALAATAKDRMRWTREDLIRRMSFGLRAAYAHGVSAIRTHLDSVPEQAERSWGAFRGHARRMGGTHRAAGRVAGRARH